MHTFHANTNTLIHEYMNIIADRIVNFQIKISETYEASTLCFDTTIIMEWHPPITKLTFM